MLNLLGHNSNLLLVLLMYMFHLHFLVLHILHYYLLLIHILVVQLMVLLHMPLLFLNPCIQKPAGNRNPQIALSGLYSNFLLRLVL